ncbi:RRP12-like protein, partial [Homalodisca vitripennis]|uniref:RRP12-like protein n=1 Tax=Homalodisca vitripennis TaxID=197043 RepID=UPI001EEA4B9F
EPVGEVARRENNQVRSLSYDLMQSQLWALLPSFCTQPSDIAVSFAVIAKPLGSLLSNQKDQRLSVMSALRHLVTYARDNNRTQDVSELARFAKNYLPILFNLYTTPVKGSDEEGIRLATLETVKVYLSVSPSELCSELFDRALVKLDTLEKNENFVRESVLDLLRSLAVIPGHGQGEGSLHTDCCQTQGNHRPQKNRRNTTAPWQTEDNVWQPIEW